MKPDVFLKFLKDNDVAIALEMSKREGIPYDEAFHNLYHEVIYPLMDRLGERLN